MNKLTGDAINHLDNWLKSWCSGRLNSLHIFMYTMTALTLVIPILLIPFQVVSVLGEWVVDMNKKNQCLLLQPHDPVVKRQISMWRLYCCCTTTAVCYHLHSNRTRIGFIEERYTFTRAHLLTCFNQIARCSFNVSRVNEKNCINKLQLNCNLSIK